MSRSIHSTYHDYWRERRFRYADDAVQEERLADIGERLARKHRIKAQVRTGRRSPPTAGPPPVEPASIPIEISDQSDWIHYPASEDDLRGIMKRLPPGALTGVSRIRLCLGKQRQQEKLSDEEDMDMPRDPWVGRAGYAHHQDHTRRIARGRWRMDDTQKDEDFAEATEAQWVRDCAAIPPQTARRNR